MLIYIYKRFMIKNNFVSVFKKQNGQALLIVVLVMVVALTVGLSIATKSITNFRSSTDLASSQKALSAAEAGIEQAIKSNLSISNPSFTGDSSYNTTLSQVSGTTFLLNGGNPVSQDSGIDLWLSDYSTDSAKLYQNNLYNGNFTLYWGNNSGDCNNAALEVVVISGTRASPVLTRYAYDPCLSRRSTNNFSFTSVSRSNVAGMDFYYKTTDVISVTNGLIARVIPLYTNSPIAVIGVPQAPTTGFPTQGSVITSVGASGNTQRRVNVFQGYPELPSEYYLYNLFSP